MPFQFPGQAPGTRSSCRRKSDRLREGARHVSRKRNMSMGCGVRTGGRRPGKWSIGICTPCSRPLIAMSGMAGHPVCPREMATGTRQARWRRWFRFFRSIRGFPWRMRCRGRHIQSPGAVTVIQPAGVRQAGWGKECPGLIRLRCPRIPQVPDTAKLLGTKARRLVREPR